ncbi:unnamed protein product, partial [Prorocentrum cordatum]
CLFVCPRAPLPPSIVQRAARTPCGSLALAGRAVSRGAGGGLPIRPRRAVRLSAQSLQAGQPESEEVISDRARWSPCCSIPTGAATSSRTCCAFASCATFRTPPTATYLWCCLTARHAREAKRLPPIICQDRGFTDDERFMLMSNGWRSIDEPHVSYAALAFLA